MSIAYDIQDGIARITFNRPAKLNAMTLAMYDELGAAFKAAGEDDRVRVVILTGAGDRAFCAGADLKESIPALARNEIDISAWDAAHHQELERRQADHLRHQRAVHGGGVRDHARDRLAYRGQHGGIQPS